jgi:hypothetical protein
MPAMLDFLYREYCRARLVEMRKQLLLIAPERHEVSEAICDANDTVCAGPASQVDGGWAAPIAQAVPKGFGGDRPDTE